MTHDNPTPVPDNNTECPNCGDTRLGLMATLRLQKCTGCGWWLKRIQDKRSKE